MATYKVLQDIEAEDKFLGPLTLKQFIFAGAAVLFGYLNFFAVTSGLYFLMVVFTPFMLLGAFLAFPWSKEQSTEVWVLAKLRYRVKPKVRIWDQSGLEQLVTITVPKKIERQLTNGLDQLEVQSRLKTLAETIDTRGWATKNATLASAYAVSTPRVDDRLFDPAMLPQAVPEIDINSYVDVLDDDQVVSENFQQMIQTSSQMHRQQSLDRMEQARQGMPVTPQPAIQFAPQAGSYTQPAASLDEAALSQRLRSSSQSRNANTHLRTLPTTPVISQPVSVQVTPLTDINVPGEKAQAEMTKASDAAIIDLARNNDLNIETIARQAKKHGLDDGEVVISLH